MLKSIKKAQKQYEKYEKDRSTCLNLSSQLRSESKASINFLVKNQAKKAQKHLNLTPKLLKSLSNILTNDPYLFNISAINEGLEEYVEAILLYHYLTDKKFPSITDLNINHEAYIGGLCDMTGELIRIARNNPLSIDQIYQDISVIYDECIQMFVKRNNKIRNKLENLERNLKKLEEIRFNYSIKIK